MNRGRDPRRELLARDAAARMERLRSEPAREPAGEGDLYALHFTQDGEEFVAEVGRALGYGFSASPVLAIFRGDPYRVRTADRNPDRRGDILVGRRAVLGEIEFAVSES